MGLVGAVQKVAALGARATLPVLKQQAISHLVNIPIEKVPALIAADPRAVVQSQGASIDTGVDLMRGTLKAHWSDFEAWILNPARVVASIGEVRPDLAERLRAPDGRDWVTGLCQATYERIFKRLYPK